MSFPKYSNYREIGIEWIGSVPDHWDILPIKRHFRLLTDKTDSRSFPVALENIESWTGRYLPTESEFEGEGVIFQEGDILFGKLRPYLAKAMVAPHSGEAIGDFLVMRPGDRVVGRFAAYQMLTREFISIVDGATFGTKMPRASWEFVGGMALPLPPKDEQLSIVAFLDRETAKIDALVAEQEKLIELLQEKRKAVISQAVTKGLEPNVPMKDSGVEWLGEVPAHWNVSPFKWQIERNDGGVWGDDPDGEQDTIVLRSTEQTVDGRWQMADPAVRKLSESEKASALLSEGDLVVTKSSGSSLHIGKTTIVSKEIAELGCCYSNFMQRVRTKPGFMPKLAWYLMNNDTARLQFDLLSNSTTGLANLNGTMIGQVLVAVPPANEQQAIINFLDIEADKIDSLNAKAISAIDLLQERRSALVSAAVTGQIDVRQLEAT